MTPLESSQRAAVVAEARSWLGTPYHHRGRIKGAGVDCAMLLAEVYHRAGLIPALDIGHYPMDWHLHRDVEQYLGWVERHASRTDLALPGDVVLFRFGRCFSHGGIVLDWPRIIHAYVGQGCVLGDVAAEQRLGRRERLIFSCWRQDTPA